MALAVTNNRTASCLITAAGAEFLRGTDRLRAISFVLLAVCAMPGLCFATQRPAPKTTTAGSPATAGKLRVTVVDENGVAVGGAAVTMENLATHRVMRGETDPAGRLPFTAMEPGVYRVTVARAGFYPFTDEHLDIGNADNLEIGIHHHQPVGEVVNVTDVAPGIDPQQTAKTETLHSSEIVNIPYPTTRDVRNVLTYIPGVVQDPSGQVHISGAASYQTAYVLDGFDINQPASDLFDLRVSPDAVRTIEVQSSRYSAQYGRASGGVLALDTRTGDDHFRFSVVNFIPTFQFVRGVHLNNWVPRATFSGPLRRKRAWFYLSQDGEVDLNIVKEQPRGADRNTTWRVGDLAKLQINLTPGNVLSTSFVYNYFDSPFAFLSRFTPQSATVNLHRSAWMYTVRDQAYLTRSTLLEVGIAFSEYRDGERPQGTSPYQILVNGVAGNYYRTLQNRSRRTQGIANLYLPPWQWHGRHELRVGVNAEGVGNRQSIRRNTALVFRDNGTLSRRIDFADFPQFAKGNIASGFYAQDRWAPSERLLVEAGLRVDRDRIVPHTLVSPRISASWLLTSDGQTKLTAGVGLFYDRTRLDFITRPQGGERFDSFLAADGITQILPIATTSFHVDAHTLDAPSFVNWSLGLERKLPAAIIGRVEFVERRGEHGFTFVNQASDAGAPGGSFVLNNTRRDHYDGVQFTGRREFSNGHAVLASYTRSSSRTNRVLEFTLDNPLFGQQAPGPLPWDTPNRIISWGWLPFPFFRHTDFAYSMEWRDGFAFSAVNQNQQLAGRPDSYRFPAYFTFNPAVETRVMFLHHQWALRAGIDDVTGRRNPTLVNNNIDSPDFLTYDGFRHRTFNGRIRFLGKK
jgi:hypothetical protein